MSQCRPPNGILTSHSPVRARADRPDRGRVERLRASRRRSSGIVRDRPWAASLQARNWSSPPILYASPPKSLHGPRFRVEWPRRAIESLRPTQRDRSVGCREIAGPVFGDAERQLLTGKSVSPKFSRSCLLPRISRRWLLQLREQVLEILCRDHRDCLALPSRLLLEPPDRVTREKRAIRTRPKVAAVTPVTIIRVSCANVFRDSHRRSTRSDS